MIFVGEGIKNVFLSYAIIFSAAHKSLGRMDWSGQRNSVAGNLLQRLQIFSALSIFIDDTVLTVEVAFSKISLKSVDYAYLLFKVISIRVSNSAVATQIHVSAAP